MRIQEDEPLASHSTFRLGGAAVAYCEASSIEEVHAARKESFARGLPLLPLGGGSNILVPDAGVRALVVRFVGETMSTDKEGLLLADAGASWDAVVSFAAEHGLWGIENLAGIPGTAGGAAVQNIGAYGAELSQVFAYVEAVNIETGVLERIEKENARFGYRDSVFKKRPELFITRVALILNKKGIPNLSYADVAAAVTAAPLDTPGRIGDAVRSIRRRKFPEGGLRTAGSFFRNPEVSSAKARELQEKFPMLPTFPQPDDSVRISLAWLLDNGLGLRGYTRGRVRLFEKQPLVLVAEDGATAREVDELADEVAERVHTTFGVTLLREVETFGARANV